MCKKFLKISHIVREGSGGVWAGAQVIPAEARIQVRRLLVAVPAACPVSSRPAMPRQRTRRRPGTRPGIRGDQGSLIQGSCRSSSSTPSAIAESIPNRLDLLLRRRQVASDQQNAIRFITESPRGISGGYSVILESSHPLGPILRLCTAGLVLPTPWGQGRGVQAFSSQEGPDFSGLHTALCLFDHAGLVRGCEPSPSGLGQDLRIGGRAIGGQVVGPSVRLASATLRLPSLRGQLSRLSNQILNSLR